MRCNSIKIISNRVAGTISYYMKNEMDEWIHVDRSSPLSRKEYTETSIYESAEKIIEVIDNTYNMGNRGVNLEMECSDDEFIYLSSLIEKNIVVLTFQVLKKRPQGNQSRPIRMQISENPVGMIKNRNISRSRKMNSYMAIKVLI